MFYFLDMGKRYSLNEYSRVKTWFSEASGVLPLALVKLGFHLQHTSGDIMLSFLSHGCSDLGGRGDETAVLIYKLFIQVPFCFFPSYILV